MVVVILLCACSKKQVSFDEADRTSFLKDSLKLENIRIRLLEDSNIFKLVHVDKLISNTFLESSDSAINYQNIILDLQGSTRPDELMSSFEKNNILNGKEIFNLLIKKQHLITEIINRFPEFSHIQEVELNKLIVNTYRDVLLQNNNIKSTSECDDSCCKTYVSEMAVCTNGFASTTGTTIVEAVGTLFLGGNLAGASFVVFTGIGAGYLNLQICQNSAARNYKICKGYIK